MWINNIVCVSTPSSICNYFASIYFVSFFKIPLFPHIKANSIPNLKVHEAISIHFAITSFNFKIKNISLSCYCRTSDK